MDSSPFSPPDWDGTLYGLATDDTVPFSRTGSGTALNIDSSKLIDWLGRTRKTVDAGGMITWYVYRNRPTAESGNETRVYPAWNTSTYTCKLPWQVSKTDKEGRVEESITLKTTATINKNGANEPDGSESLSQSNYVSWTRNTYNTSGQVTDTKRYHAVPASEGGTRYSNYYQTDRNYDSMGRLRYTFEDVADESPKDREQVTQSVYDKMGRVIETKMAVSGSGHLPDVSTNGQIDSVTMVTVSKTFYDDPDTDGTPEQGVGDGRMSWTSSYYGTGGSDHNDTAHRYDWRGRLCVTVPPASPYSLVKYDNLDRVTASGTFSTSATLDASDDPAEIGSNGLSLDKTYYDEFGRVYKTERFMDPGDPTPADALTTNTYHDRRSLVWASQAPGTGITFSEYDGAGRRTALARGAQFDAAKYTSSAPDYPDSNEGIVERTEYTLNDEGNVTKTVRKELNHDDSNGLGSSDCIRTYSYNWYDSAHRLTDTAAYGTNNADGWKDNSTAPTYDSSAPARSDTILVTTNKYNTSGRLERTTDPKVVWTKTEYDALDRVAAKTADFNTNGTPLNRKTEYQYNGQGSLARIIADQGADNTFSNGAWTMAGSDVDQVTEYAYTDSQSARWVKEIRYPTGDGTVGSASTDKIAFTYHVDGTVNTRTDQNGTVLTWSYDTLRRKTQEQATTFGTGVDQAVKTITWTYTPRGQVQYATNKDASSAIVNQIKNTYDSAGDLTKQEQEYEGAVDGSTRAVEVAYETDFTTTGNYKRKKYLEHPNDRKIWMGYTHTDTGTFQDTVNDEFSRVGQIAYANPGGTAKGDVLFQYDRNGLNRGVRIVSDNTSGWFGNKTRKDLWMGTSGDYDGLDRFGRIVDLRHVDFDGGTSNFVNLKYTRDRNGNPTVVDDNVETVRAWNYTFDNLNRLANSDLGVLESSTKITCGSKAGVGYAMDILGNFGGPSGTANGITLNKASGKTIQHIVNATNEITSLENPNSGEPTKALEDAFTASLCGIWSQDKGGWSIASSVLQVDTLTSGQAIAIVNGVADNGTYSAKVKFPTSSGTNKAGVLLGYADSNNYYVVWIDRNAAKVALHKVSSGSLGAALASSNYTAADSTWYKIKIVRWLKYVDVRLLDNSNPPTELASFTYDAGSTDLGQGKMGLYSDKTTVQFDDFTHILGDEAPTLAPRIGGNGKAKIVSGKLEFQGLKEEIGEAVVEGLADDDYITQVTMDLNSGASGGLAFRYQSTDHYYAAECKSDGAMELVKMLRGDRSVLGSSTYTTSSATAIKVKASGSSLKVWIDGTLKFGGAVTDGDIAFGRVALKGDKARFDDLKAGYDNNADDDIDDAGDDVVINEDFASTSTTVSHDESGNLTDDGVYKYTYDAWNRLVKVAAKRDADVVFQTAAFDAMGRRSKKGVTKSGDLDGTEIYYWDDQQVIEVRDGSGNVLYEYVHGLDYIDEVLMAFIRDQGWMHVHQDANWNVVALTNMRGHVKETYTYEAYGQRLVHVRSHPCDFNNDGQVNATDQSILTGCASGSWDPDCSACDLDGNGSVQNPGYDKTEFNTVTWTTYRMPGTEFSLITNPLGHQGLILNDFAR